MKQNVPVSITVHLLFLSMDISNKDSSAFIIFCSVIFS